jgi:phosphomevalonate kinase
MVTKTTDLYAPGKLFVLGEWSVLRGAPAVLIAAPGGQRGRAVLSPGAAQFDYLCPSLAGAAKIDVVGETELACQAAFGALPGRLALSVEPEGLDHHGTKLGFGSSASVAALIAHAWARACDVEDLVSIRAAAMAGHRRAQGGRGSGADVALSATFAGRETRGLSLVYRGSSAVEVLEAEVPVLVTAVWTGRSADSRELMDGVSRSDGAEGVLARLARVSEVGAQAWLRGDGSAVLRHARRAGELLRELGDVANVPIVTDEHNAIAAIASDQVVCKPSGAGGGDMALLMGDDQVEMQRAEARLVEAGYLIYSGLPG